MIIHRLGMTETAILVLQFAYEICTNIEDKKILQKHRLHWMNWLYSTCGYYDKKVNGTYFDFKEDALTENYLNYINIIKNSLKNSDKVYIMLHEGSLHENLYFLNEEKICNWLEVTKECCICLKTSKIEKDIINNIRKERVNIIYNNIKNRNILVVSPFGELIKENFLNGGVYSANENFPSILGVEYVTPPYCFTNDGPNNNALETLENIWNNIKEKNFDVALLSCGSYGHELCNRIGKLLKKDAIYVGGELTKHFGIIDKRSKQQFVHGKGFNFDKMIEIPEKYRPTNYIKVENGCYW